MNIQLIFSPFSLLPELSGDMQALFRVVGAGLLLGTLLLMLPHARRYFLSEKWGGYGEDRPEVNIIQNPYVMPVVLLLWFTALVLLIIGRLVIAAALTNLVFCWYFFIFMRWRGILRGQGAPGFMSYWLSVALFLLTLTTRHAPQLHSLALWVIQVDFALIMLSAGIYKYTAGYRQNEGYELGMVNPEWGYWLNYYQKVNPAHWVFRFFNQMAWLTEVSAGLLMLFPPTRFIGGLIILLSFIYVASQIRLGMLAMVVMVSCMLFFHPGSAVDQLVQQVIPASMVLQAGTSMPEWLAGMLRVALWGYIILLPLAHGGLFYNFYGRKRLIEPLQKLLEWYTNLFGIIIWRVFSVDVVNFFVEIWRQDCKTGDRTLVSQYGWPGGIFTNRFNHVAESITITSVFTSLKYYSSQPELFKKRLLRYACTFECQDLDEELVFRYISIRKAENAFVLLPVSEFIVRLSEGTVVELTLEDEPLIHSPSEVSPVFEGYKPGTYAPKK